MIKVKYRLVKENLFRSLKSNFVQLLSKGKTHLYFIVTFYQFAQRGNERAKKYYNQIFFSEEPFPPKY